MILVIVRVIGGSRGFWEAKDGAREEGSGSKSEGGAYIEAWKCGRMGWLIGSLKRFWEESLEFNHLGSNVDAFPYFIQPFTQRRKAFLSI